MTGDTILQYISDFLSLITIGMCLTLKVPQINKLLESKTAVGISVTSLLLELTSYSLATCYNYVNGYSLLSYLEYPILLIQEYILIYLVLKYLNLINTQAKIAVVIYLIICVGFLTQIIPKITLVFLEVMRIPMSASSKILQLMAILRIKNADGVSPKTWFLSAMSNLTRVFTVWMDSADILLLGNFFISISLSLSIMFLAIYYSRKSKKVD